MHSLQRPRPSPPARCRHPASVFRSLRASGHTGAGTAANLNFK
ncbi:unnamed protein product [Staurois parvus]|uniref:Uncharacterized protein n=1 Tax=Staurois parvus TaxID=386267 RepID=A0ABN9AWE0_9NEOB|nr:unnamed protein product [Staurois parvus]